MEKNSKSSLSREPYKGVRDFYPPDMFVQKYIFEAMRKVAEKFGYEEYGASVLEPAELYRAKTGEEIVNEQTYTFKDRGDREVTLRPEMTPTLARMVAGKKRELAYPLRWYSIPNLFRYEKPQRGRVREHWQLNVDIFGVKTIEAETEIISIASEILKSLGLKETDFEIRINSRKIMNYIFKDLYALSEEDAYKISKLIDKKNKISKEEFEKGVSEIAGEKSAEFLTVLNSKNFSEFVSSLPENPEEQEGIKDVKRLIESLENLGITNVFFDQSLMRGFDYYTGIVFEVYDKNPANPRSIFGGGRYDDLLSIFGEEKVPAVGFGAGDVIIRDILETYKLLPPYKPETNLYICLLEEKYAKDANELAQKLREEGLSIAVDYSGRKAGDQIKSADKRKIPYILCIGENEIKTGVYKVKNLETGEEKEVKSEEIFNFIKSEIRSTKFETKGVKS